MPGENLYLNEGSFWKFDSYHTEIVLWYTVSWGTWVYLSLISFSFMWTFSFWELGSAVAQLQDEHGIKSRSSRNSIKSSGYPSIDRHLSSAKDQVCV